MARNPDAVLLFDEIEKADLNVIHLFLQLLDNGTLEDKFTESNVAFKDTIIIMTTNAGRRLYDDPNSSGVSAARPAFHRRTILGALEKETDPRTGRPFFPQAICSRLATGYPIMFNRLGVVELETIARKELQHTGALLEKQYGLPVEFGSIVPLCLVMTEGGNTDARTVRAQAEIFVKSEMFKLSSLYRAGRLKEIMAESKRIVFDLDSSEEPEGRIKELLHPSGRPRVLLAVGKSTAALWESHLPSMDFQTAGDPAEALNLLDIHDFDFILLDLWFEREPEREPDEAADAGLRTVQVFDHVPASARSLRAGRELLRQLREKHPELPCWLASLPRPGGEPGVDEELLTASIRSGGARGVIVTGFTPASSDFQAELNRLSETLTDIAHRLHRSRQADELGAKSQALTFETAPTVSGRPATSPSVCAISGWSRPCRPRTSATSSVKPSGPSPVSLMYSARIRPSPNWAIS